MRVDSCTKAPFGSPAPEWSAPLTVPGAHKVQPAERTNPAQHQRVGPLVLQLAVSVLQQVAARLGAGVQLPSSAAQGAAARQLHTAGVLVKQKQH